MYITLPEAYKTELTLLLIAAVILAAAQFYFVYWLIKIAIRDGIKESGLVEALRRQSRKDSPPIENIPNFSAD